MHLFLIILKYVGVGFYGFGIPIAWMLCEKEKEYSPASDRWFDHETPKWWQALVSIGWPLVIAITIIAIPIYAIFDMCRAFVKFATKRIYRFTHRKQIAQEENRRLQIRKDLQERQRKYQEQMLDAMRRQEHADKYL